MRTQLDRFPHGAGELFVAPWPDEVIDALGLDPRSMYVETYWLGVLGPTGTWLLRLLVQRLDHQPEGYWLSLAEAACQLGIRGSRGRHSNFVRAMCRLVQFDLAVVDAADRYLVRRRVPPLNRHQLLRLPAELQDSHAALRTERPEPDQLARARVLAQTLRDEMHLRPEEAERELVRWGFGQATATQAAWNVADQLEPEVLAKVVSLRLATSRDGN